MEGSTHHLSTVFFPSILPVKDTYLAVCRRQGKGKQPTDVNMPSDHRHNTISMRGLGSNHAVNQTTVSRCSSAMQKDGIKENRRIFNTLGKRPGEVKDQLRLVVPMLSLSTKKGATMRMVRYVSSSTRPSLSILTSVNQRPQ